ncbi:MAG: hypothetical protein MUF16_24295 [Burkholderiaceae bacterium]|jgi:hypothetical protein|nr:hypothetical protein [Burkholderiaceae bacterium]
MAATLSSQISMPAIPRARPAVRATRRVAMPATTTASARMGWLERLALWAEAQPAHRRLGSWTMDC